MIIIITEVQMIEAGKSQQKGEQPFVFTHVGVVPSADGPMWRMVLDDVGTVPDSTLRLSSKKLWFIREQTLSCDFAPSQ